MGPLKGLKILEFAGIGPGPFCGMLLADLGAEVIRLDKSSTHGNHNKADIHNRNKKSITADLKNPESIFKGSSKQCVIQGMNSKISMLGCAMLM